MKRILTITTSILILLSLCACSNKKEIKPFDNNKIEDSKNAYKRASEEKKIYYLENGEFQTVGFIEKQDSFEVYESKEINGKSYYKISELNNFWIDDTGLKDMQDVLNIDYSFELNNLKEILLLDEDGNILENKYIFNYDDKNNLIDYLYCGYNNSIFNEDYFDYLYGKDVENILDNSGKITKQIISFKNGKNTIREYSYDNLNRINSINTFIDGVFNNNITYEYKDKMITINNDKIVEFNGNLSFVYVVNNNQLDSVCIRRYDLSGKIVEQIDNRLVNRFSRMKFNY